MPSKPTIFDKFLHPLAEIAAPTTPRSWVLNGYGRAEFSMSTSDPKCTETIMQFGNLVHIKHIPTKDADGNDNGKLPDWVGMVLPERGWDYGVLHKNVYTVEGYLVYCPMPFIKVSGSPKTIFLEIIKHANDFIHRYGGGITFQPGIVDDLPLTLSDELTVSAYEHIQTLTTRAGMNWDITSEIDEKGNLLLFANLYQTKGVQTDLTLSNLNSELGSPLLSEQGNIWNVVIGYSQANTKQDRIFRVGINQEAVNDYGPFGINQPFLGMKDAASVQLAAETRAMERGRPIKKIHRIALDRQDTFSHLETGNILSVKEANAGFAPGGGLGFDAQAKITSMDYNDLSNKAPLNVEVI